MLQNARVTACTVSELLRENQQGKRVKLAPLPRIRVKISEDPEVVSRRYFIKKLLGKPLHNTAQNNEVFH